MGDSYENFREIVGKMISVNAIRIVKDELELEIAFEEMLKDQTQARAMGERGRKVFEEQQGATKRTVDVIVGMVKR
jgi:3-deoxy-D-manno-octulosonic-acid transferase